MHIQSNQARALKVTLHHFLLIEIEPPKENGEQEIGKWDKLLTTTFQIEIEN